MSLTPWDYGGVSLGFGLYRPRRPSYTLATQCNRQRSESYRYATRNVNSDSEQTDDYIDDIVKRHRKDSYIRATRPSHEIELQDIQENHDKYGGNLDLCDIPTSNHDDNDINRKSLSFYINEEKKSEKMKPTLERIDEHKLMHNNVHFSHVANIGEGGSDEATPCSSEQGSSLPSVIVFTFKKNLIILCTGFILIFSAFRGIQNLQSSINTSSYLGITTMTCVYVSMFCTCIFAPIVINIFTAKWALSIGMLCFLIWFGANFYPRFYTLIPTAIFAGFGQGILWSAEISYILKLAFDSARITKDQLENEMFRFHGIFLACFQTTHIWGNLISSVLLSHRSEFIPPVSPETSFDYLNYTDPGMGYEMEGAMEEPPPISTGQCGALNPCDQRTGQPLLFTSADYDEDLGPNDISQVLWKLMCAYIILGFIGFGLILLLLDKIGARSDPDKTGFQLVVHHFNQMVNHKTFRMLIPLLIFNGVQQGFIFSDFNHYFVTCALGVEYIGYSMIILGVANVLSSIMVALCARYIPREVVLGFGGVMHIALMIGFLIWIPNAQPLIFFLLSAAWGVCDAVWQTQCNTLICITCLDDPETAFANYRMLQSLGLALAFGSGTFFCVSAKLYFLMTLLVVAIMFYVLAEYRIRQTDSDDVFETQ